VSISCGACAPTSQPTRDRAVPDSPKEIISAVVAEEPQVEPGPLNKLWLTTMRHNREVGIGEKYAKIAELEQRAIEYQRIRQDDMVRRTREQIEQLHSTEVPFEPPSIGMLFEGDVGRPDDTFDVVTIVDDRNMVARYEGETVWLRGWGTRDLAENNILAIDVAEVTGRTEYTPGDGQSMDVLVLEPFDFNPYIEALTTELEMSRDSIVPGPVINEELVGSNRLALARHLIAQDQAEKGRRWLQEIIDKYPDTKAAGEAAKLLRELPVDESGIRAQSP
jgi:hypothetical protein